MIDDYLVSVKKEFHYYKYLGNRTFEQLTFEQINWQYNKESNSIAIIVKHLCGNMLSRWTDFLSSDGEKPWRDRDAEFDANFKNKGDLLATWEEGWQCLFTAIESINEKNIDQIIYIRNMGHSVTEAINRQLAHYSYHVGQIVFIGRMIKCDHWTNLSIDVGKSQLYNEEKFANQKQKKHFTDDIINQTHDQ